MPEFADKPAYEIARRLEVRGTNSYSWFILIKPDNSDEKRIDEFCAEIHAFLGVAPRKVDVTGLLADDICAQMQKPPHDPLILTGLDDRTAEFWFAIDINRSGLERSGPVIFWISSTGVSEFCRYAPNLRSFVGGSIFVLGSAGGEMSALERGERLKELSLFYKMSSDDVIKLAEQHSLPPEPEYIEWLVLLGRGDLV